MRMQDRRLHLNQSIFFAFWHSYAIRFFLLSVYHRARMSSSNVTIIQSGGARVHNYYVWQFDSALGRTIHNFGPNCRPDIHTRTHDHAFATDPGNAFPPWQFPRSLVAYPENSEVESFTVGRFSYLGKTPPSISSPFGDFDWETYFFCSFLNLRALVFDHLKTLFIRGMSFCIFHIHKLTPTKKVG